MTLLFVTTESHRRLRLSGCRPNPVTRLGGERYDLLGTLGFLAVKPSGSEEKRQGNLRAVWRAVVWWLCAGVRAACMGSGEWRAVACTCEDPRNPSSDRPGGRSSWLQRTKRLSVDFPPFGAKSTQSGYTGANSTQKGVFDH